MRQKLGVALAVIAIALSGAREATEQFHQLKSLAGGWATTNAWNSLLVYAAGTFEGLAPQKKQAALVASNTAASCDATRPRARRAAKPVVRRPARVKAEAAEPLIAVLALGPDAADSGRSDVEEFRIEVGRDAGVKGAMLVPRFAAADFETEVAREDARSQRLPALPGYWVKDFTFKFRPALPMRSSDALRRNAQRRRGAEPSRVEATGDEAPADAQEVLFEAPSDSGMLNCDDEPRR